MALAVTWLRVGQTRRSTSGSSRRCPSTCFCSAGRLGSVRSTANSVRTTSPGHELDDVPGCAELAVLAGGDDPGSGHIEGEPGIFDHFARITDRFVQGMAAVLDEKQFGTAVFGRSGQLEFIRREPASGRRCASWVSEWAPYARRWQHHADRPHQPGRINVAIDALDRRCRGRRRRRTGHRRSSSATMRSNVLPDRGVGSAEAQAS